MLFFGASSRRSNQNNIITWLRDANAQAQDNISNKAGYPYMVCSRMFKAMFYLQPLPLNTSLFVFFLFKGCKSH